MAAWAVGHTDRFAAAVMGAGVSDWGMLAATGEWGVFETALGGSTGWEGAGPHRHDQLSPISYASAIRTPVLIVHGADDTNVPVSQAEYFHRALRRFGVEHGLPALPTAQQALEWIERQRGRLAEGIDLSFAIADAETNTAVGGLWLQNLPAGRATAGYSVSAKHRGRGAASSALMALTTFAWTIPTLYRVELYIEPWNTGSVRVAEASGYQREGLLRSRQEIGGIRRDMLLYVAIRP